MLKLIACSFYPLNVNDLAEAINVSECIGDGYMVTADAVRRILVGFITETSSSQPRISVYFSGTSRESALCVPVVQLAHASVLEYLIEVDSSTKVQSIFNRRPACCSCTFVPFWREGSTCAA
jgi:hypothetical protein